MATRTATSGAGAIDAARVTLAELEAEADRNAAEQRDAARAVTTPPSRRCAGAPTSCRARPTFAGVMRVGSMEAGGGLAAAGLYARLERMALEHGGTAAPKPTPSPVTLPGVPPPSVTDDVDYWRAT